MSDMERTGMPGGWTRRGLVAGGLFAALVGDGCRSRLRAQVTMRVPAGKGAVTPQDIDLLVERRAADVKRVAPKGADRYVLFDIAYPLDAAEYRAVGKTALLLTVAVSRDADELPLRRVFTRAGSQDIDLQKLGSRRSELPAASLARAVVGPYREDAFYLAPIGALLRQSLLMCDFAKNREGFVINRAPLDPPAFVRADRQRDAADKPAEAAIRTFVDREYPGFGILER
jgi:hypothetical protein